jgi:2-C-methyl-D-erythritol 4-phosphate cytidylyltransferase
MTDDVFVSGIIVAAGSGTRMGRVAKPFIKLGDRTVLEYVLDAFLQSCVDEIIIVCADNSAFLPYIPANASKPIIFAEGGRTRTISVYNGVSQSKKGEGIVCIHDCARPFVTADIINEVVNAAKESGAATASHPVKDTIKYVNPNANTVYTPERKFLLSIQTPQAFKKSVYSVSFMLAQKQKATNTDETALAENAGFSVAYVNTPETNIKLTTPEDIKIAKSILFLKSRGEL